MQLKSFSITVKILAPPPKPLKEFYNNKCITKVALYTYPDVECAALVKKNVIDKVTAQYPFHIFFYFSYYEIVS